MVGAFRGKSRLRTNARANARRVRKTGSASRLSFSLTKKTRDSVVRAGAVARKGLPRWCANRTKSAIARKNSGKPSRALSHFFFRLPRSRTATALATAPFLHSYLKTSFPNPKNLLEGAIGREWGASGAAHHERAAAPRCSVRCRARRRSAVR